MKISPMFVTTESFYRRVWSSPSRALSEAVKSIPEIRSLDKAMWALKGADADQIPRERVDLIETLAVDIAQEITDTGTVPATFARKVHEANREIESRTEKRAVFVAVQRRLVADRDAALVDQADAVRACLHEQLTAVVADAAKALPTDTDSDTSIALGRVKEHEALQALARRYADIREGQFTIDRATIGTLPTMYKLASLTRNLIDVEPLIGVAIIGGRVFNKATGESYTPTVPGPDQSDAASMLVWLASSDAQSWVPSKSDLMAEIEELDRHRRRAGMGRKESTWAGVWDGELPLSYPMHGWGDSLIVRDVDDRRSA